jgi:uncharacterized membrane protein
MRTENSHPRSAQIPTGLSPGLWIVQVLLALTLAGGGVWKLATPIEELAETFTWAGEVPSGLVYTTAVFDILGGLGVLLPSVTRVMPRLAVLAALGCVALLGSATVFHLARGEVADTPLNVLLAALAFFVAWGRHRRAPIAPRA